MKFKKCIPVLLVLSLVLNVGLICKLTKTYELYRQQGIRSLDAATVHLITVMPRMEDPEDWTSAAVTLDQILQTAHVWDRGDNLKVYRLIQAVYHVPGSQDRTELRKEIKKLAFARDSSPWKWSCNVIKGAGDKIMELCGYD